MGRFLTINWVWLIVLATSPVLSGCAGVPGDSSRVSKNIDGHAIANHLGGTANVYYNFTKDNVVFTAHIPASGSIEINLDGDQNGKWGDGPDQLSMREHKTNDLIFGETSSKELCSGYIMSSAAEHPELTQRVTHCGQFKSSGSIEIVPDQRLGWINIKLAIPIVEIFGDHYEAHLQVCLWEGTLRTCRYSPAAPFIIARPPPVHP